MIKSSERGPRERRLPQRALMLLTLLVVGGVLAVPASGRIAVVPQNTSVPTIGGTLQQGSTLTASNGVWTFGPTSFAYQWQRCDTDGTNCNDLAGATSQAYTLVAGDVTQTVVVVVTASNADGMTSATSSPSPIISSTNGPQNTAAPVISGSVTSGTTLTVSNGTWSVTPSSFTYQWQRCAPDGSGCLNVPGSTNQTYLVGLNDRGHTLQALVTAHTASGDAATAYSNTTGEVPTPATPPLTPAMPATPAVTTTTTTTTPPTLAFLSLRRSGEHIYASFHVCETIGGAITVTERVTKARAVSQTQRLVVSKIACGRVSANWPLLMRFRTPGRLVVTLQAKNQAGAVSKPVSRSLVFH